MTRSTIPDGKQPLSRGRAANGRSTIYRDAEGVWHGQVSMGRSDDGKSVRRHVRGRTRTEVTTKVEGLEDERARSAGRPSSSQRQTVGQWLDEWLVIIQRTRKPKTHDTYTSLIRVHCRPLRRTPLTRVTVRDIDNLLHRVAQRAPQSAVSLHRVLRSAFNTALKRGLIAANPCAHAVVPRVQEAELVPYTLEECRRLLATALSWVIGLSLRLSREGAGHGV